MWEVTLFDGGFEVGTFDYDDRPEVGTDYGDCVVLAVRDVDVEGMTASVDIEYVG